MLLHDARRDGALSRRRARAAGRPGPLALGLRRRSTKDASCSTGRSRSAAAARTSLQAAIASLHSDEQRDRAQIAALYGELARVTGSPVVAAEPRRGDRGGRRPGRRASSCSRPLDLDGYRYLHVARGRAAARGSAGRDAGAAGADARARARPAGAGRAAARAAARRARASARMRRCSPPTASAPSDTRSRRRSPERVVPGAAHGRAVRGLGRERLRPELPARRRSRRRRSCSPPRPSTRWRRSCTGGSSSSATDAKPRAVSRALGWNVDTAPDHGASARARPRRRHVDGARGGLRRAARRAPRGDARRADGRPVALAAPRPRQAPDHRRRSDPVLRRVRRRPRSRPTASCAATARSRRSRTSTRWPRSAGAVSAAPSCRHALDEARRPASSCSSRRSPTTGRRSSTRSSASTSSTSACSSCARHRR